MKHDEAARTASEDRKLALAAMLQKAREAELGKGARQEDKQAFEKPKQDAQVKNLNAKTDDIGFDNDVAAGHLTLDMGKFGETQRHNKEAERLTDQGQATRLLTLKDLFSGDPQFQLRDPAQGPTLSNVGPATHPDDGTVPVGKVARNAAAKDLDEASEASADTRALADMVRGAKKHFFGTAAGGVDVTLPKALPFVGGKSVNIGKNTWADMEANMDRLTPEQKKDVAERQAIKQAYGVRFQKLRHTLTGAAFSDKESRDYATQLTSFSDDPFAGDQELLAQSLERASAHADRRTKLLQYVSETGRRPKDADKMSNAELEQFINGGGQPKRREPEAQTASIDFNSDQATAPPLNLPPRKRKTNPATGETREWDGKRWVPIQ
jgi:hypothetical protein